MFSTKNIDFSDLVGCSFLYKVDIEHETKNIEYHLDPKVNAIGYQKLLELMIRQGRWS